MRRSAFRRPAYVPPPSPPLRPVERTGVMVAVDGDVVAVPKVCPVRSQSYLRWVASLPCVVCGIEGYTQAAHPNYGRGKGQKASDLDAFPLCCTRPGHMGHHVEHDTLIGMTRDQRRELEVRYTAQTQALARSEGRPEVMEAA